MKDTQYNTERDLLIEHKGRLIPSPEFCTEFIKRLPSDEEAEKAGYYNDSADYHAWGKALFGDIHIDAELTVYQINIFEWVEIYEQVALNQKLNHQEDTEQVKRILNNIGSLIVELIETT